MLTLQLLSYALFSVVIAQDPWINEIHYDNAGTDTGEFIEIAGTAGTDLTGYNLYLYNGFNGEVYNGPLSLGSTTLPDQGDGIGTAFITRPTNGLQNGGPDGIVLTDASDAVIQFLSYEGQFTGTEGPANGMTSVDIGVVEGPSTAAGTSLSLTGIGTQYSDFTWEAGITETPGLLNVNQRAPTTPAPITPAPITPAPITPAPITPAPVTPAPITPAPITPAPITPAPITPAPITPAPITPAPITPAPITPAPVTPAPITPAPITPAPITPAPVIASDDTLSESDDDDDSMSESESESVESAYNSDQNLDIIGNTYVKQNVPLKVTIALSSTALSIIVVVCTSITAIFWIYQCRLEAQKSRNTLPHDIETL